MWLQFESFRFLKEYEPRQYLCEISSALFLYDESYIFPRNIKRFSKHYDTEHRVVLLIYPCTEVHTPPPSF